MDNKYISNDKDPYTKWNKYKSKWDINIILFTQLYTCAWTRIFIPARDRIVRVYIYAIVKEYVPVGA